MGAAGWGTSRPFGYFAQLIQWIWSIGSIWLNPYFLSYFVSQFVFEYCFTSCWGALSAKRGVPKWGFGSSTPCEFSVRLVPYPQGTPFFRQLGSVLFDEVSRMNISFETPFAWRWSCG
ncbi:hypothetical protein BDZ45DRAFT_74127 [Acephala macrosclerotiorum]|nr:hypothetical protein BDZ45DRAFT_74127 [Acephala macrosclerotiorum]